MAWGVRTRITTVATLLVAIVLVIVSILLTAGQRRVLTDNVDEVLSRQMAEIIKDLNKTPLVGPLPAQGDDEAFARVTTPAGVVVASTAFVPDGIPALQPPPTHGNAAFFTVRLRSGVEYRIESRDEGDVTIRVGTPLDDVNDSVLALVRGLALLIPVAVLALAAIVWLLVGRALRPVERNSFSGG